MKACCDTGRRKLRGPRAHPYPRRSGRVRLTPRDSVCKRRMFRSTLIEQPRDRAQSHNGHNASADQHLRPEQSSNENKLSHDRRWQALFFLHNSSLTLAAQRPAAGCISWLSVSISAPAKSRPTRIELYPREFVFCPYRCLRVEGLRIIERRYCHVNSIQNPCMLPS